MGDISEHFSSHETRCRCGRCPLVLPSQDLLRALEDFRGLCGCSVYVNSCARCPPHNAAVGGAGKSRHLTWWGEIPRKPDAADVIVPAIPLRKLFKIAREVPELEEGGIGIYPHWPGLHLDVRGKKARWFQKVARDPLVGIPGSYYL